MVDNGTVVDDDLTLVQRICAGERHLFHDLVQRYERSLYRTALAVTRNAADAEDVVQEALLRAYEHLEQFRGEARFPTWLTQITLNTARMRLRKEHLSLWESLDEPIATDDGWVQRDVVEWRENPEELYSRGETEQILHQALRGLPRAYREVLVLRDIQLLSTQETADVLGISLANVKTRLLRARLQLRDRLSASFGRNQGESRE